MYLSRASFNSTLSDLLILIAAATFLFSARVEAQKVYLSPNGAYRAIVADIGKKSALTGCSGESRVEIRTIHGLLLCRKSYGSSDGEHGLGVQKAEWTPDSQFFVYSATSSGGHSPWHDPTYYWNHRTHRIDSLDAIIGPVTTPRFRLTASDLLRIRVLRDKDLAGAAVTIKLGQPRRRQ